jgi:hypothetical protein
MKVRHRINNQFSVALQAVEFISAGCPAKCNNPHFTSAQNGTLVMFVGKLRQQQISFDCQIEAFGTGRGERYVVALNAGGEDFRSRWIAREDDGTTPHQ